MLDRSFLFCLVSHCCNFFFSWCGYHLDLHVLTHSVPTRRLFRSYRIRDELNVERAAQGKPPIAANQWRTAAGKRAAKAAEWLDGAADILRFRALIIELGYDAAIPAMKREIRERDDEIGRAHV